MEYIIKLYNKLKSSNKESYLKRFNHSVGVAVAAIEIAKSNNLDIDYNKLYIAGLLHDYAKYTTLAEYDELLTKYNIDKGILNENPKVLHGICGYLVVRDELNIVDDDILSAIKYHVFGKANMSLYEEIVYLADYIEANRMGEFYDEIRKYAFCNYKKALAIASKSLIEYLETLNGKIHPNAYLTYEYYKKYLS